MALKVGELYASLRLDSKGFDDGLDKSKRSFDGLRTGMEKGVKTAATVFAASTTAVAGLGVAALKVGLDYNRLQQSSRAALSTLLGGAEAANAQMDKLDEFARTSPFAKQVFITAQQQLLGFGVAAEDVIPTLDAVQNAVAAVGGGNEEVSAITYALAQMQGQGKLTGQTLSQLGEYGIDAATIVGEKMGMTGEEIRKLASKPGGIPVKDVFKPLTDGLIERFGGATDAIKEQMDGAADRVKGAWRDIGSALAKPLVDPLGGGMLVDWTNAFADAMRALEAQIKPTVEILVKRYKPALDAVTPALQKVKGAIDGWDVSRLNAQLDEMGKYAPLIAGVSTALFTLGTNNIKILQTLGIGGINPLVAGFAAMVAFSPELRTLGTEFLQALSPLIPIAQELTGLLADSFMSVLHTLTPALGDLLKAAADMAIIFGVGLAPAVATLIKATVPLAEVLANIVSWFAELPTPVLTAMTAFMLFKTPVGEAAAALTGGFVKALSSVRDNLSASRGMIEATGGKITTLGTVAMTARAGVSSLGTAMKAAFVSNLPLLAIAAITTAIGWWAAENAKTRQTVDDIKESLDQQTGAITDNTRALALKELRDKDAVGMAEALGISLETVIDSMLGNRAATEEVTAAIADYEAQMLETERETGGYTAAQTEAQGAIEGFHKANKVMTDGLDSSRKALDEERRAGIKSKDAHNELAGAVDTSTEAIKRGDEAVRALRDSLDEFSGKTVDARKAELRFKDAVDAATEASKENSDGLDDNTRAGRDNELKLIAIRDEAINMATEIANSTGSQEKYTDALRQGREALIRAGQGFGLSKDEARKYADEILKIPSEKETKALFDDISARNKIAAFKRILAMPTVRVGVDVERSGYYADRADGGIDEAGRHVPRVPQVATGGRYITWQEDETVWESYISGKPSARQRNLAVMDETAKRLGGFFIRPMANGGITGPQRTETITPDSGQRPIYITINSVESDHVDETAKALNFALRTRGGLYSRS